MNSDSHSCSSADTTWTWSPALGTYVDEAGRPVKSRRHRRLSFVARTVLFVVVFGALQLLWEQARGGPVEHVVIHDGTVQPAVWLVNLLTPSVHAVANDATVHAPGGGINIINGCEGTEALFLLIAAFLVASIPWRSRLLGLLLGVPVVFAINQARILTLFYAYRMNRAWFDPLHATVTPVAVIVLVCAYFYVWLVRASRTTAASA